MPAKRNGRWTKDEPSLQGWYWCRVGRETSVQHLVVMLGDWVFDRDGVSWKHSLWKGWHRWSEPIKPPEVKRG